MRIYSAEFILPILLGTQGYLTQGYFTRLFNRLCYPEFILRALEKCNYCFNDRWLINREVVIIWDKGFRESYLSLASITV